MFGPSFSTLGEFDHNVDMCKDFWEYLPIATFERIGPAWCLVQKTKMLRIPKNIYS